MRQQVWELLSYASGGSVTSGNISLDISSLVSPPSGSLVVVSVAHRGPETFSLPSGWFLGVEAHLGNAIASSDTSISSLYVIYTQWSSSSGSIVLNRTGGDVALSHVACYYCGGDFSFVDSSINTLSVADTTVTTSGLITTQPHTLILGYVAGARFGNAGSFSSASSGLTSSDAHSGYSEFPGFFVSGSQWGQYEQGLTTSGSDVGLAVFHGDLESPGASGAFSAVCALSAKHTMGILAFTPTIRDSIDATSMRRYTVLEPTAYTPSNLVFTDSIHSLSLVTELSLDIQDRPLVSALETEDYWYAMASGGVPPYEYTLTGAPPDGWSMDINSGVVTGIPTVAGLTSYQVHVLDGHGNALVTSNLYSTINPALTLTGTIPLVASQGISITPFTITASGGVLEFGDDYYYFLAGPWATGLSINSATGEVTGTPSSYGSDLSVSVGVYDTYSVFYMDYVLQTVYEELNISYSPTNYGATDIPFTGSASASGGASPLIFSKVGTWPAGISLNDAGVLGGTPTTPGVYDDLNIRVTDNIGTHIDTATFYITVYPALTITVVPELDATENSAYAGFTASSGGGSGLPVFSLQGAWPAGLSIDSMTGVVSGTPTVNGAYSGLYVRVTDGISGFIKNSSTFTITIAADAVTNITPPSIVLTSGGGYAGSVYTATPGVWSSGTPTGQWTANGADISGETSLTLIMPIAHEDKQIVYVETNDGVDANSNSLEMWNPNDAAIAPVALFDIRQGLTKPTELVERWDSQVGSLYLDQSVEANQPLYSDTSFDGDSPGIYFDSTDSLTNLYLPVDGGSWTIIAAITRPDSNAQITFLKNLINGNMMNLRWASYRLSWVRPGVVLFGNGPLLTSSQTLIYSARLDDGVLYKYSVNGVDTDSGVPAGQFTTQADTTHKYEFLMSGKSASTFMVFPGYLSDADTRKAEGWLAWTIGKSSKLDVSHDYKLIGPTI